MSRRSVYRLLYHWLTRRHRASTAGFTLIELLVTLIIGTIIVVALLGLVNQLVSADRRDASRTETQRDLQLAMNYVVEDLREAVYVYAGNCIGNTAVNSTAQFDEFCPGLANHLPTAMVNNPGYTPILAFWRTDNLPDTLQARCRTEQQSSNDDLADYMENSGVDCISGRSYTLVVYGVIDNSQDNPNNRWRGKARLVRYALPQFNAAGNAVQGYVDPKQTATPQFQQWPFQQANDGSINNNQAGLPTAAETVLVDFVDDGQPTNRNANLSRAPSCATGMSPTFNPNDITDGGPIPGFYGCVRGKIIGGPADDQNINQEVFLTIVGNVEGRSGYPITPDGAASFNHEGKIYPLQTRVLVRGALNKSPF